MRLANQTSTGLSSRRRGAVGGEGVARRNELTAPNPQLLARGLLPRLTVQLERPHPSGATSTLSAPRRRCAASVRDRGVVERRRGRGEGRGRAGHGGRP